MYIYLFINLFIYLFICIYIFNRKIYKSKFLNKFDLLKCPCPKLPIEADEWSTSCEAIQQS